MTAGAQEFRIRRMSLADLEQVMDLGASLSQAPHWPRATYEAAIAPGPGQRRRIALVAEDMTTGRIAGFAVAVLAPPESELESIAIAAEFQRRGAGRQLFGIMANFLRGQQVKEILLEVRVSNEPAQSLYRMLGFVEAGCRPGYYADPVEDAALMRLNLE
jgi:ribosomal-protein-alanine N-acetyltransferase